MTEADRDANSADGACMTCGACCAAFRVAFHWSETELASHAVPIALATPIDPHRLAMRGTDGAHPHCVALEGNVGERVRCTIYPHRPSPCRAMRRASAQCDRARAAFGLAPVPSLR